jgi:hypothetical protein
MQIAAVARDGNRPGPSHTTPGARPQPVLRRSKCQSGALEKEAPCHWPIPRLACRGPCLRVVWLEAPKAADAHKLDTWASGLHVDPVGYKSPFKTDAPYPTFKAATSAVAKRQSPLSCESGHAHYPTWTPALTDVRENNRAGTHA